MLTPIPDYNNLDLSGEVLQAATRMEARAVSRLPGRCLNILSSRCCPPKPGPSWSLAAELLALSRRIAQQVPHAMVFSSEKSTGMLTAAQSLLENEKIRNIRLAPWDVLDESAFPLPRAAI